MATSLGVLLFDGFELLDVFGPVQLFSKLPEDYTVSLHARNPGLIQSSQGAEVAATADFSEAVDMILVPGGMGTRALVDDEQFIHDLSAWGAAAEIVTSVCTGSALLAQAGLLEGHRATTNKRAFNWASSFGNDVTWVPQARWVHDRSRWTSSGVAAGMDMTAAFVEHFQGSDAAAQVCETIELEVHRDSAWDPFAAANGLV